MKDQEKTREQLISELEELRRQIATNGQCTPRDDDPDILCLRDGEARPCRHAVVVANDFTKQADEALRQSHAELRAIYDGMFDGLLIVDMSTTRFVKANPSICRMLGYSEAEVLSMSIPHVHPAKEISAILERLQARAEGRFQGHAIVPFVRKNGSMLFADVVSNPITYGGRLCLATFVHDITDRKLAEEALRQSEEHLAERTALAEWRASQLQRLTAELTQAEERERRRLARVLHDHLQQILVAAKLEIFQMGKRMQAGGLAAGTERIRNLLDEAIEESRSLATELSPPVLYEQGLAAGLQWLGQQTQAKLLLTTSVQADATAEPNDDTIRVFLFQAARELILNAAKHGRPTSVTISLSNVDEGYLRLTVTDDGVGCDPNRLSSGSGEAGFGLFSIRERLALIGGSLEITSTPGQGTKATMTAPSKAAPPKRTSLPFGHVAPPESSTSPAG
jgi:PAS domain S-box-containing protein